MIEIIVGLAGMLVGSIVLALRAWGKASKAQQIADRRRRDLLNANEAAMRTNIVYGRPDALDVLHENGAVRERSVSGA